MDNMDAKGIGGHMTCYAAMKGKEELPMAKPPVTCYAPMKGESFTKGESNPTPHNHQGGRVPTAACYMPVDDWGLFGSDKGSQTAEQSGLSQAQMDNRMKLMEQRAKETKA